MRMADMSNIGINSAKAWLLAARPKTLPAALLPVGCGLMLAVRDLGADDVFLLLPAVLCILFAVILQIAANYINDYFDYLNGIDGEHRTGPGRACAQGWITPWAMRMGIGVTVVLACLCGLPLVIYGGMEMLLIGGLCVAFCFLYTTHLSYMGLGDLLVLVFFGIVPVCVVYYIQLHTVTFQSVVLSIGCGFVVDTLLLVNNCRDCATDRAGGKNTLVVRLGRTNGCRLYLAAGIVGSLIVAANLAGMFSAGVEHIAACAVAACLAVLLVVRYSLVYRTMISAAEGDEMESSLGTTSANMLLMLVAVVLYGIARYVLYI